MPKKQYKNAGRFFKGNAENWKPKHIDKATLDSIGRINVKKLPRPEDTVKMTAEVKAAYVEKMIKTAAKRASKLRSYGRTRVSSTGEPVQTPALREYNLQGLGSLKTADGLTAPELSGAYRRLYNFLTAQTSTVAGYEKVVKETREQIFTKAFQKTLEEKENEFLEQHPEYDSVPESVSFNFVEATRKEIGDVVLSDEQYDLLWEIYHMFPATKIEKYTPSEVIGATIEYIAKDELIPSLEAAYVKVNKELKKKEKSKRTHLEDFE